MLQHSRRPFYRFPILLAVAAMALSLGACSSTDSRTGSGNEPQFAAGWSEHTKPLLYHGFGRDPSYTIWQVPNILPRGTYRVIVRKHGPAGDTAELVDGQRFEVDDPMKDIYLNILASYRDPEAIDEKYIVDGARK